MATIIQALTAYTRSPIGATDTTIPLKYLKDSRGNYITAMPSGATLIYATLEPKSPTNQEIISFTGIQNDGNNQITLTGVTRNLSPQPPYATLGGTVAHGNNIEVILSNNPPFYNTFVQADTPTTISALWTFLFGSRPVLSADGDTTNPNALITYGQLARTALGSIYVAGKTVAGTAGENVTALDIVYLDVATGKWFLAKADTLAKVDNVILGIAKSTATTNNAIANGIQLDGFVTGYSGLTIGTVYASNLAKVSNTAGTNVYPIGVALSATDIVFDSSALKKLSYNEKNGLSSAYPSKPSTVNPVMTKDILYTDGISTNQLTDNADVYFGQNDATTKRLKLAQTFIPTKSSIGSLVVKKGTGVKAVGGSLSGAGITATFSGGFTQPRTNNNLGNFSGSMAFNSPIVTGIASTAGLQVGDVINTSGLGNNNTGSFFTPTGNFDAFHTRIVSIDSSTQITLASNQTWGATAVTFNLAELEVVGTNTSFLTQVAVGSPFRTSVPLDYTIKRIDSNTRLVLDPVTSIITSFSGLQYYPLASTPNVSVDVYLADASNNPTGGSLGTATISGTVWDTATVNSLLTATFATPITGLDTTKTYVAVLTSASPSSTTYPAIRKTSIDVYANGLAKYNNTTDGWVTEGGDLYFQVNQSITSSLVTTDTSGKLPASVIPTSPTIVYPIPSMRASLVGSPFGAGSATSGDFHIGYDASQAQPTYMWLACSDVSANANIYRFERQTTGNYIYKGVSATFAITSGILGGITETGGKVYVKYVASTNIMGIRQYALDLTNPQTMTGGLVGQVYNRCGLASDPAGNKFWSLHSSSTTDMGGYTISGTTLTRSNTVTLSPAMTNADYKMTVLANGDFVAYDGLPSTTTSMQRWTSAGATVAISASAFLVYTANAVIAGGWFTAGGVRMVVTAVKSSSNWILDLVSIDL